MKQPAKDRYDLVDSSLVSRVSMAQHGDRTHLVCAFCELKSRILTAERRVQAHGMTSVKLRSAREAVRLAARRKMVGGN